MIRKIIHFDLDAFYCAVEEQRHAELKGVPIAVGGRPESRGVVSSCSYAARRFGIRSAMGMAQAVRLCPQLRILPPDMARVRQVSKRVMAILQELTPLVEQLSIDEAFLDVTERSEYATALARRLQAQVEERLGLPSSLGVATNKLVAKIATDVGKSGCPVGRLPASDPGGAAAAGGGVSGAAAGGRAVGSRSAHARTAARVRDSHGRRSRGGAAG